MPSASQLQSLLLALSSAGVDVRQLRVRSENTVSLGRRSAYPDDPARRRRMSTRGSSTGFVGTLASAGARRSEMLLEGSAGRRRGSLVRRRVRDLRRLVPVGGARSRRPSRAGSVEGLLREAADYITRLQLQVKLMRSVVDALSER